jgi:hypothetical protein
MDQRAAAESLTAAEAAHIRAQAHLKESTAALHTFDGLDESIAASVISNLRDATGIVTTGFDAAILERDRARTIHTAGIRAVEVLGAEVSNAMLATIAVNGRVDKLVCAILNATVVADLTECHADLRRRIANITETIFSFNLFAANRGVTFSPATRAILGHDVSQLARARDKGVWVEAAAKLKENPDASMEI